MKEQIFALIDINNCYASIERFFNPQLIDKPIIILSNNDTSIVARSDDYVELNCNRKITLTQ
ncbi:Y-family DNA polymerase [Acinetobacter baumannii]|uniref:Y-family DNA polymerase n=1 Tax=Acinetobacter baumannii TaxID=470 RepID=UPI0010FE7D22|nr:hypothetical protein FD892_09260 [Acinetobacter baumannii]